MNDIRPEPTLFQSVIRWCVKHPEAITIIGIATFGAAMVIAAFLSGR